MIKILWVIKKVPKNKNPRLKYSLDGKFVGRKIRELKNSSKRTKMTNYNNNNNYINLGS